MLQIDHAIISLDVLEKKFICDLETCKGECCVEGEDGAPLEAEEVKLLEDALPYVLEYLPEASKELIKKQGVSYIDRDGDAVTSIVNGEECVFVYTDENGYSKCAIERAYLEGKISFRKPISCYLYPIRLTQYTYYTAVNYHKWHICDCALKLGQKEGVELYKFLKEPLTLKFGAEWYEKLEIAAEELKKNNLK